MRKLIIPLLATALTIAVITAEHSSAEGRPAGMGKNMPVFADCDLDGDGSITESEFLEARSERIAKRAVEGREMKNVANAPSFQDIDTDANGTISNDEFDAHQAEHKAKMRQR